MKLPRDNDPLLSGGPKPTAVIVCIVAALVVAGFFCYSAYAIDLAFIRHAKKNIAEADLNEDGVTERAEMRKFQQDILRRWGVHQYSNDYFRLGKKLDAEVIEQLLDTTPRTDLSYTCPECGKPL